MRKFLIGVLLVSQACIAGEKTTEYSPWTKSLVMVESHDGDEKGWYAEFKGKVWLTGKLIVEFDRETYLDTRAYVNSQAYFRPDSVSRSKLPAAVGEFYPQPVELIALGNDPRDLLLQLVGRAKAKKVLAGNEGHYEFEARIRIHKFSTGVDCDHRWYSAAASTIEPLKPTYLAQAEPNMFGC